MSEHVSTERMNDVLDGLVEAAEQDRVEVHLRECGACREAFAGLSETVSALRGLPRIAEAPEGLWSGIAARIQGTRPGAGEEGPSVLSLPGADVASRRRWTFSAPQMAAAAAVAALISAGVTWSLLAGPSAPEAGSVSPSVTVVGSPSGPAARAVSPTSGAYEAAVDELEAILTRGRGVLAPETLLTLEASLDQIDEAMAEVSEALVQDPSSEILARMLAQHRTTKLRVLRQAAAAVRASL